MNRRRFLSAGAVVGLVTGVGRSQNKSVPGNRQSPFPLEEVTVSDLQSRMKEGAITAEEITNLYFDRIESLDRSGPEVRAIIETNPDALATARALDIERKNNKIRGPLHGIPVLLKDNIDTADRMQTTAGSLALLDQPTPRDSWVADKLRAAGAIILGKTNLSEWANFRSTHSTSGWSGRGGQTRNPYVLDRNPCGSSSGSGAAVSANLGTLAIGTETDGSVVCPSSMCGIVGIKPTLGLISRSGIIPIAHSQDTAGPMARTVRDAAILLGALTGVDARDSATDASRNKFYTDYTQFLVPDGLKGARIGIARQYFNISPAVTAVMEECIALMQDAGAVIIDPANLPSFEKWRDTELQVLLYEFKADLNSYLAARGGSIRSLQDVIGFNSAHPSREMPYFGQELMDQAQQKGPLSDSEYKDALHTNHKLTRKEGIDAVVSKYQLDAIVGPTSGPSWTTDWVSGDHADSGCASPPAVAGYPHVTVPAGFVFGLPIGISFFGAAWSEPKLLKLAYSFEQARRARRKPQFASTVDYFAR